MTNYIIYIYVEVSTHSFRKENAGLPISIIEIDPGWLRMAPVKFSPGQVCRVGRFNSQSRHISHEAVRREGKSALCDSMACSVINC